MSKQAMMVFAIHVTNVNMLLFNLSISKNTKNQRLKEQRLEANLVFSGKGLEACCGGVLKMGSGGEDLRPGDADLRPGAEISGQGAEFRDQGAVFGGQALFKITFLANPCVSNKGGGFSPHLYV